MNILTKNIRDLKFDDVVEFCKQQVLEGVQLDYKMTTPKDLAKHFASFSNTQGGLIIIGVEEDDKGLPTAYGGVPNDSKLVDRIHQFAANVTPLPTYDVCLTDEQKGNVFVLVRIYEGAAPPYTTSSDPTVWIRNGNISTSASREELLRLDSKKREAAKTRGANAEFAEQYFKIRVGEAETERHNLVQAGEQNIYQHPLGNGNNSAILTITIQPYYPDMKLVEPQELLRQLLDFCGSEYHQTAFVNGRTDTLPGGIADFIWSKNQGTLNCAQLYANGLSYIAFDVLDFNKDTGVRDIKLIKILSYLRSQLKLVQNYYGKLGYSGLVVGDITLSGGQGAASVPLASSSRMFFPDSSVVRLPNYKWSFELDTNTLSDDAALTGQFVSLIKEISWGLGVSNVPNVVIDDILKMNGWQ
ncbi:MAG TPA: ATP-binding protein [Patescibacteria group bacterium]|jgi:hypothetical protein|nr:ATP-binding protein [Patescibacteria group bacterium]